MAAVVAVSPTYFGAIQDIQQLSAVCHKHGVPLLVDEAHGSHLSFLGLDSALQSGADVVVQSTHKTLTALSQAAMLHQGRASYQASSPNEDGFGEELRGALSDALELLQSSSPSSV